MATQYELLLTQNVAPTGQEFSEKYVLLNKGSILTGDGATKIPYAVAAGTDGMVLKANSAINGGLEWVLQSAIVGQNSHAQNTDTGTTSNVFEIGSGANKMEVTAESTTKLGVKVDGGATYADFQAKDATFNKVTIGGTPSANSTDAATTSYVDAKVTAGFAANNAMVYQGTIGTGGTLTIAAFNALTTYNTGWTYRVIEAGTIRGAVCEIGDLVTVIVTRTGTGNLSTDFTVAQTNIDGAVVGPTSTTDNYVALFSGTTGKLLKAGTGALGDAAYTNSSAYATAAQGTLANNAIPKGTITAADQVVIGTAASTPSVISVGASTFVGKKATGAVTAMSVAEAKAVLAYGTAADQNTSAFDAAGAATTATSTHAALQTGVHGISITTGKTLSVSNSMTFSAAADGNTLNIGAGGTLGTAAFTAASAYDASGAATTATSTHAALQTGVHGISITASKVLSVTNNLTLSGTDMSTLNIGLGGTLGTAAFTAASAYATAAQGTTADNAVAKSTFTANSMLYATTAATPAALTVGSSTFVGRKAAGDISAMSVAEAMALLWQSAPAAYNSDAPAVGLLARDAANNFMYVSTTAGTTGAGRWKRFPMATNW